MDEQKTPPTPPPPDRVRVGPNPIEYVLLAVALVWFLVISVQIICAMFAHTD